MSLSNWKLLKSRLFLRSNSYPRRGKPRSWFIPQFIQLEDRCVPAFIPTLTNSAGVTSLNQVLYTLSPGGEPANLPVKLVTIMNNSNQMVYPILFGANSTIDETAGQVVRITLTQQGGGYDTNPANAPTVNFSGGGGSGATARAVVDGLGKIFALDLLTRGAGYTSAPTITFGGSGSGAFAEATISTAPLGSGTQVALYDALDPYNNGYRGYVGELNSATGNVELGIKPGHEVTLKVPLVLWDGGRLFLASNGAQAFQSETDPGNPLQDSKTWNYKATATRIVVDATFQDPADGSTNPNGRVMWYHDTIPHDFGTDGPGQLTEWSIRDPLQVNWAPNMGADQLQVIFNYDVSYVDNLTLPAGMEITKVPIQTPPNYNGQDIQPAPYAVLGTDLTIPQMQQKIVVFAKTDPTQANADLGTYFGGRGYDQFYLPSSIDFDKLPAGYNLIALAPNTDTVSVFDSSKYQLISGGNRAQVDTHSTGLVTKDSNQITNVATEWAKQLAPGMLTTNLDIFEKGSYILSVTLGTDGNNDSTIVMSSGAVKDGPNQSPGNQLSYTFFGSQFSSSTGSTNGSTAAITNVDPKVGIYLRPGMLVTGPGINSYTKILTISSDYKTVTLDKTPAAGSGSAGTPYRFTGAPSSYVVTTLINNWYSWADYYVSHASPNTALSSTGHTRGHTNGLLPPREDPNTLILENLAASVVSQLKVGQVVTGPNITANPNDPSQNTVIAKILSDTSIQLSLPVLTSQTGTYFFGEIKPIVRASDAQPYTLTFTTQQQRDQALAFSQTVYDVMQGFSLLKEATYLSKSALLLQYIIGGNIGTFALQAGKALPLDRLTDLRDELKSVLRGVADFGTTPEFDSSGNEQWYPDPKVATPGALLNGQPATFGVYNLNPYVWFIHIQLGMSGYGFSLDDDTSNAQDRADSLQVAYGGTAATAPGTNQKLQELELYTYGAPFGTLQDQGHIDATSQQFKPYIDQGYTVIAGLSVETVAKLKPFDAKSGQGALVTGPGIPEGTRVFLIGPANPVNGVNASFVVLEQPKGTPKPTQNGPTATYLFSGHGTRLPVINAVTPGGGAIGTQITLTGSDFTKALGVTFNGFPASTFSVSADGKSITVTVPVGASSGKIGVRGPAGTGYSSTDFTITGLGSAQVIGRHLVVNGTNGHDVIQALPTLNGRTNVLLNGRSLGTFAAIDRVFINGLDGNDFIFAGGVRQPLTIDGGQGHDHIVGGQGDDTLIGGLGDDVLVGGRGRDQLLGGAGNNRQVNLPWLQGWPSFWISFVSWLRIKRAG